MRKITMVLLIVGLFLIPTTMIPLTHATPVPPVLPPPDNPGDIIFSECGNILLIRQWDHALIFTEDRPGHSGTTWGIEADPHTYPEEEDGIVEWTTLAGVREEYPDGIAYGIVDTSQTIRNKAIEFSEDKINKSFDYLSYWVLFRKDVDGTWPAYKSKYYCTELVWASYRKHGVQLDPDGDQGRITPNELYYNTDKITISDEWGEMS